MPSVNVFQEFADWFEAQLDIDLRMLPLDAQCTCGDRRKLATHLPGCNKQLVAQLKAARWVLDDARHEPPDFSMRVAAMALAMAYADRDGYEKGWHPYPLLPPHIQETIDRYPEGYVKRERPARKHETVEGD